MERAYKAPPKIHDFFKPVSASAGAAPRASLGNAQASHAAGKRPADGAASAAKRFALEPVPADNQGIAGAKTGDCDRRPLVHSSNQTALGEPQRATSVGKGAEGSAAAVAELVAMGFSRERAEAALKQHGGSVHRAADWLCNTLTA
jgi:hypothetical protein